MTAFRDIAFVAAGPASERRRSAASEARVNHALSLTLELLEQTAWGLRVRLTARNDSGTRLYLPAPDVTGLRFGDTATRRVAEWYTTCFVSAAGDGRVAMVTTR